MFFYSVVIAKSLAPVIHQSIYDHDHYNDIIMGAIASQITSLMIVYSIVYSGADQRKHQSSTSLAFVRGIHQGPMNSPHKGSVTRKMFPLDDVIMWCPASSYGQSTFRVVKHIDGFGMMVADVQMPNRHQAIGSKHTDFCRSSSSGECISRALQRNAPIVLPTQQ